MQQSTVTDYFKTKKRTREESISSSNKVKLIAATSSSGKDGPSPIRSTSELPSPENESEIKPIIKSQIGNITTGIDDRKMTITRRVVKPKPKVNSTSTTSKSTIIESIPTTLLTSVSTSDIIKPSFVNTGRNGVGMLGTTKKLPNKLQLQAMKSLACKLISTQAKMISGSTKNISMNLNDITPIKKQIGGTASPLQPISPSKFFSTSRQRDIFSSPVKLSEIHSPSPHKLILSPAGRSAVKRLFSSTTSLGPSDSANESPLPKKIPAYQRFHHLAQKTEVGNNSMVSPMKPVNNIATTSSTSLVESGGGEGGGTINKETIEALHLPFKFKVLQELFQAVETVTSILYNRKELITFEKVRPAVQQLVRRITLKEKHLGQMLNVFPGCYTLCYEKLHVGGSYQDGNSQLIIGINLLSTSGIVGGSDIMSPNVITERRRIFRMNLLKIAHSHHRTFLSSLIPPIIIPTNKLVTRWHPKFRLDEVPDVDSFGLPVQCSGNEKVNTAKDVIAKAQHIIENANPRMKKALQDLLKKTTNDNNENKNQSFTSGTCSSSSSSTTTTTTTTQNTQQENNNKKTKASLVALKGISQSLIEKIRAREQEKSIRAMTLTPEETKQEAMLNQLPDFVKMLRNIMVAEKKSALALNFAIERLCHSTHGSISFHDVEDHIRILTYKLPMFASIIRCTQGEYLKIDKTLDINNLLDNLKLNIKEFK